MGNQRAMVEGNNCSFRHDMNKGGKSSPSNPSQNSFMQQSEQKPSRTRVAVLGKNAHLHIVRFEAKPTKWSKSNNDKSAVAILKKGDWHERGSVTDQRSR